jgi:RNA polymerase sigma-70 factor (ECF subfamily)
LSSADPSGPEKAGSRFEETQWTLIGQIPEAPDAQRREILEGLCRAYWRPVYSYLRFRGQDHEDARDLTQAFFAEIVFGKNLIERADRKRGRFRTFLLTALNHFVQQEHRKETAQKRAPREAMFSLQAPRIGRMDLSCDVRTPEQAFTFAWAAALVEEVVRTVRQECLADGMAAHWAVFEGRVVHPMLHGAAPQDLGEFCREYGLEDPAQASNMLVTVKRRFRMKLRSAVRRNLRPGEDVEEEIRDLMQILSHPSAG